MRCTQGLSLLALALFFGFFGQQAHAQLADQADALPDAQCPSSPDSRQLDLTEVAQVCVPDNEAFCAQCSCALFTAFKPELSQAGLFDVPEGGAANVDEQAVAAAVTRGASVITQCVQDFIPQFLAGGVTIQSLTGLAECEFQGGEAPQCLVDRVSSEIPGPVTSSDDASGQQGGSDGSSSSGAQEDTSADVNEDVGDAISGGSGTTTEDDGTSSSPTSSGNTDQPGATGDGADSSSSDGSNEDDASTANPPGPSSDSSKDSGPAPDSSSPSSSSKSADSTTQGSGAGTITSSSALIVLFAAAAVSLL